MEESQERTLRKLQGKGLEILHWMDPGSVTRPGLGCEFKKNKQTLKDK